MDEARQVVRGDLAKASSKTTSPVIPCNRGEVRRVMAEQLTTIKDLARPQGFDVFDGCPSCVRRKGHG
jgi:hypothetical protein